MRTVDTDAQPQVSGGASTAAPGYEMVRSDIVLTPDSSKVVIQPLQEGNDEQQRAFIKRITGMTEERGRETLGAVMGEFEGRHPDFRGLLEERFRHVAERLGLDANALSETQRLLIGAYFLSEYSLESAALFNPSLVPHPDQSGVPKSCLRVIISLRATGEGHISSIEFRTGLIDSEGNLVIDPAPDCVSAPMRCKNPAYKKSIFRKRLEEMDVTHGLVDKILGRLGSTFSHDELEEALGALRSGGGGLCRTEQQVCDELQFLSESNYMIQFPTGTPLSQRVVFPQSQSDRQGIEDARFVRFASDAGEAPTYYATYTAWNGQITLPQLIETRDFAEFRLSTLSGKAATNKGMAIFPRRVNGRYATLARSDGVNHFLAYSDDIYHWDQAQLLARPLYHWELLKVGNCGSPLETDEGWLVITHGVGGMRRYCMGAMLLDLDDPSQVIGRLKEPLLEPNENERVGYVPNVVYSCGAYIHMGWLVIPYAMSDYAVTSAKVWLDDLLDVLKSGSG